MLQYNGLTVKKRLDSRFVNTALRHPPCIALLNLFGRCSRKWFLRLSLWYGTESTSKRPNFKIEINSNLDFFLDSSSVWYMASLIVPKCRPLNYFQKDERNLKSRSRLPLRVLSKIKQRVARPFFGIHWILPPCAALSRMISRTPGWCKGAQSGTFQWSLDLWSATI